MLAAHHHASGAAYIVCLYGAVPIVRTLLAHPEEIDVRMYMYVALDHGLVRLLPGACSTGSRDSS